MSRLRDFLMVCIFGPADDPEDSRAFNEVMTALRAKRETLALRNRRFDELRLAQSEETTDAR